MLYKELKFQVKSVDETGHFSGYANTWEKDLVGDTIMPGAFKRTIKNHRGRVPILKGHNSEAEIGITSMLAEDDKGLQFEGDLYIDDANPKNEIVAAREEYIRMKRRLEVGKPLGISIGFTIPSGKEKWTDDGEHLIYECALWEISTTPFPANPSSIATNVKSMDIISLIDSRIDARLKSLSLPGNAMDSEQSTPNAPGLDTRSGDPDNHSLDQLIAWIKTMR